MINYLTAGGAGALKISSKTVKAIIAIIDMGGSIFNGLFKLVGKLGASGIRAALKGVRSVLQQIPGMGAAVDWIDNVLETVFKHGDEVAENTAKHADEAAEQSARQADEGAGAARHGDEAGEQAGRQADEAGGQAARQADQVAQRAAIAEARLITEAAEKAGVPVFAVVATLNSVVKPRYPRIGTFKSKPKPGDPGAFKIFLNPQVDPHYEPKKDGYDSKYDPYKSPQRAGEALDGLPPGRRRWVEEMAKDPRFSVEVWTRQMKDQRFSDEDIQDLLYRATLLRGKKPSGKNWGEYVEMIGGGTRKPKGMVDPHGHHLAEKVGGGQAGRQVRETLEEVGINPLLARVNLTQAPRYAAGQHGRAAQAELLRRLNAALQGLTDSKDRRKAVTDVLLEWAKISAARK